MFVIKEIHLINIYNLKINIMDLIKIVLVFVVLCIVLSQIQPMIETFYPQVSGLPFKQETMDNNMYMCKDSNDLPYSCHGQAVTKATYDKYSGYTGPCPKNWLIPGNSIYQ
jgi:hypothetical protein